MVPEGLEIDFISPRAPGETFWRQLKHAEFDASEMSLSAYILLRSRGDDRFVGIPVFPLRAFRHSYIFVNEGSGIETPEQLAGRTVGVPEYHMTAALFIRGMLADEYGVDLKSINWIQGGQEKLGRRERVDLELPADIRVHHVGDDTLSNMLENREIDALFTAVVPSSFFRPGTGVRRLFDDPRRAEADYFKKTGIYPIMHLVVLRHDVYERAPWVAQELLKAFEESKRAWFSAMVRYGPMESSLPWFALEAERTIGELGADYWPYGLEKNRPTLEAAARYSLEQGLSARPVSVQEMFVESTWDSFVE